MIVLLHGVPETTAIWRKVREQLDEPSVALALPGFGTPRPEGFPATKEAYLAWLVDELEAIDEPIDLVGHDWGAGITYGLVTRHPGLVRTWAADVANIAHPDYVWHEFARTWQTPGDGEAFVAAQEAQPVAERAEGFALLFGLDPDDALELAAGIDATMGTCILDLYRSAVPNLHATWGPWAPTDAPGLVLHATAGPFGDEATAAEVAASLGAQVAPIDGAGHFWPASAPAAAAAALRSFWSAAR